MALLAGHSQVKYLHDYLTNPHAFTLPYSGYTVNKLKAENKFLDAVADLSSIGLLIGANDIPYNSAETVISDITALCLKINETNYLATVYISDILPRADDRFANSTVTSSFLADFNSVAVKVNLGLKELSSRFNWIRIVHHDFYNKDGTIRRELLGRDGLHLSRKGSNSVALSMQDSVVKTLVTCREEIVPDPEPTVRPTGPLTYSEIVSLIPPVSTIRRPVFPLRRLRDAELDQRQRTTQRVQHKRRPSPEYRPPAATVKRPSATVSPAKKASKLTLPTNLFTVLKVEKSRFKLVKGDEPKNVTFRSKQIRRVTNDAELNVLVSWIEGPDSASHSEAPRSDPDSIGDSDSVIHIEAPSSDPDSIEDPDSVIHREAPSSDPDSIEDPDSVIHIEAPSSDPDSIEDPDSVIHREAPSSDPDSIEDPDSVIHREAPSSDPESIEDPDSVIHIEASSSDPDSIGDPDSVIYIKAPSSDPDSIEDPDSVIHIEASILSVSSGNDGSDISFWLPEHALFKEDKELIYTDTGLLNDNVINTVNKILHIHFPEINGFQDTLYIPIFNDNTGTWALNKHLKRQTAPCVHIHHNGKDHWLMSYQIKKNGPVYVIDSLRSARVNMNTTIQIAQIYTGHNQKIKLVLPDVQRQTNSYDCGVFAIAYLTQILNSNMSCDMTSFRFAVSLMRSHLLQCLENGSITPFPKIKKMPKMPCKQDKIQTVKLVCHCQMPDVIDDLIKCENTACITKWFHRSCSIKISDSDIEAWFCSSCTN